MTAVTLPLDSPAASLDEVGGKGRSLSLLAATGLPIPDGFLISTTAYREFVEENDLQSRILELASGAGIEDVDDAARDIGRLFETASLPTELERSICQAYGEMGEPSVAVRSSATAEDLPDLSFAGQQDTYLNVRGEAALLAALRRCWASLWNARALSYRARMGVDNGAVAMGVVVQIMVDADVSGILFTANPTTGERSELVVNASFGLGEAIVGGQVTPDTFILNRDDLSVVNTITGSKMEMVVAASQQGIETRPVSESRRDQLALSAERLAELGALGLEAERVFSGEPQDIEWAYSENDCWLLQSRPITSLPAPPFQASWEAPYEGARLVRRQVVENMPEPLSPLFEELYLSEGLDRGMDHLMAKMGIPLRLDDFITRPLFLTVNGYGYCRYNFRLSWRMLLVMPRVIYWYVAVMPKFLKNLLTMWREEGLADYLSTIDHWHSLDTQEASHTDLLNGIRSLALADATYWFYITMMVGAAKITEGLLSSFLSSRRVKGELTSGMFLRGFASKTLDAHRHLLAIAGTISADASAIDLSLNHPPDELGELIDTLKATHPTLHGDISEYLAQYGHQVYNLDFVAPTTSEDPTPVLLSLQALVRDGRSVGSWDTQQEAMIAEREKLEHSTAAALGPLRRRVFAKLLRWAQTYGPYREEALFYMGAAWPTLRKLALELGARLVAAGRLAAPDDVFYLEFDELEQASAPEVVTSGFMDDAADRRALRTSRQTLHPPGRVPENLRFKFGPLDFTRAFEFWETQKRNEDADNTLTGFAVSPGQVTGIASVILSPADFAEMQPDTILVCPTTTPAWTPLFGQAVALVTDIGAVLAHGSIVAREYGIPAVLGTGNVTARIVSGQRITVDGNRGTVTILDPLK